jgi:hypothetical protein
VSICFRLGEGAVNDNDAKTALLDALNSRHLYFQQQAFNNFVATAISVADLAVAMNEFWVEVGKLHAAGRDLRYFWMHTEDYDMP